MKIHLIISATGQPIEFSLTPEASSDTAGLRALPLDLPKGATLYADRGYTDYHSEDVLHEIEALELTAARKKNSKCQHPGYIGYLCHVIRKRVETTFSLITERFARHIHAVTPKGFELKVFLTVLAYQILA